MIGLNNIISGQSLPGVVQAYYNREADIAFNFQVMVGGIDIGDFYAVEGLSRTVETYQYKELGRNTAPITRIQNLTHSNVILKWGLMNRSTLWDWMQEVDMEAAKDYRRDVFILQLNRGKIPLRMFMLRGAFPVRWTNANLDAGSSTAAVEELELAYEDLEVNVVPLPF